MIYSKTVTDEQREILEAYENETLFEPMLQEDFDEGKITFAELVKHNLVWYEDHATHVWKLITDYMDALDDEEAAA